MKRSVIKIIKNVIESALVQVSLGATQYCDAIFVECFILCGILGKKLMLITYILFYFYYNQRAVKDT
jgi:hypothetical protein